MPSTSKSNERKPKQQWQVNERNWLELPSDVMANILSRVGVRDILENAQQVCTAWRKIGKDPSMRRVICMDYPYQNSIYKNCGMCQHAVDRIYSIFEDRPMCNHAVDRINSILKDHPMCKHAVDRSQGQLIDITIGDFGDDELLQYVADRSSQLRRLKIVSGTCYYESWTKVLKKFPLLEELSFHSQKISKESVKAIVPCCPWLKTLKLNVWSSAYYLGTCDEIAITIGENLHDLEHLELIGNRMSNIGLKAILDGCCHLKSLDLRRCRLIDLEGDLGERCSQQIKCLKRPYDSLQGCQYFDEYDGDYDHDDYN